MKLLNKFSLFLTLTLVSNFTIAQTQKVLDLIDSMEFYYADNEELSHKFGIQAIYQAIADHDLEGEALAYKSIAANHIIWDYPDSTLFYVDKAVPIFSKLGDTMNILYCQQFRISALQLKEENLIAIELYKEMIKNQYVIDFPKMYYRIMQNLAILYTTIDHYQSAEPLFVNVLNYYKSIHDTIRIINSSCDIMELNGLMNYENGYESSLSLFDTAYQLTLESNDLQRQSILLIRISNVYLKMGKLNEAKQSIEKSLIIQDELGDLHQLSSSYKMRADIYIEEKKYDLAMDDLYRSLKIDTELDNKTNMCSVFERMGNILQIKKQHHQAINYFNQAIEIAKEFSLGQQLLDCIQARTISLAALGEYDQAKIGFYEYLKSYNELQTSDQIEKKFWEDELIQQQKDKEIKMEIQKRRSYTIQAILICIGFIIVCWLFISFGKLNKPSQKKS